MSLSLFDQFKSFFWTNCNYDPICELFGPKHRLPDALSFIKTGNRFIQETFRITPQIAACISLVGGGYLTYAYLVKKYKTTSPDELARILISAYLGIEAGPILDMVYSMIEKAISENVDKKFHVLAGQSDPIKNMPVADQEKIKEQWRTNEWNDLSSKLEENKDKILEAIRAQEQANVAPAKDKKVDGLPQAGAKAVNPLQRTISQIIETEQKKSVKAKVK